MFTLYVAIAFHYVWLLCFFMRICILMECLVTMCFGMQPDYFKCCCFFARVSWVWEFFCWNLCFLLLFIERRSQNHAYLACLENWLFLDSSTAVNSGLWLFFIFAYDLCYLSSRVRCVRFHMSSRLIKL